jgi:plasmid stabilization system protein ParE
LESAIEATVDRVAYEPTLGHKRHFKQEAFHGLRSLHVTKPFDKLLLFYRVHDDRIEIWRLMHGARHLSRRLLEAND